jgi:hypothetical protein
VERISAQRYRSEGKKLVLAPFSGRVGEYREFDGVLLPARVEAIWEGEPEDFCYFRGEVTAVQLEG